MNIDILRTPRTVVVDIRRLHVCRLGEIVGDITDIPTDNPVQVNVKVFPAFEKRSDVLEAIAGITRLVIRMLRRLHCFHQIRRCRYCFQQCVLHCYYRHLAFPLVRQ
ncbi:hypothetical protein D3C87_1128590 [compost metagenome]